MPTRKQLRDLAQLRLKEAEALFAAGLYDGAVYLSGYVVELALKARVCRLLELDNYPDTGELKKVYAVHNLDQLLILSGVSARVNPKNPVLYKNWSAARDWRTEQRYQVPGTTQQKARDVLDAIRDRRDGVLTWIKKHW